MRNAVLVPGLLCTGDLFAPQMAALQDRFGVVVGDHRRHDTMAEIARHILGGAPDRFVLAGLSMGGYVAFEIMRQAPERVEALILLDTSARPDTPEQTAKRQALLALADAEGLDAVMDRLLPLFLAPHNRSDPELVAILCAMAKDTGRDGFARQQAAIVARADSRPTLAKIACPTLVVVGDQDALTPPELSREIAAGIQGALLETIPECGHILTLERPAAVTQAIVGFLETAGIG